VRVRSAARQHQAQVIAIKSNTALRRPEIPCCYVQENGAARAGHDRVVIVAKDYDEVVKIVVPPQMFGAGRVGVTDGTIVVWVRRRVAPTVGGPQGPYRQ